MGVKPFDIFGKSYLAALAWLTMRRALVVLLHKIFQFRNWRAIFFKHVDKSHSVGN